MHLTAANPNDARLGVATCCGHAGTATMRDAGSVKVNAYPTVYFGVLKNWLVSPLQFSRSAGKGPIFRKGVGLPLPLALARPCAGALDGANG